MSSPVRNVRRVVTGHDEQGTVPGGGQPSPMHRIRTIDYGLVLWTRGTCR